MTKTIGLTELEAKAGWINEQAEGSHPEVLVEQLREWCAENDIDGDALLAFVTAQANGWVSTLAPLADLAGSVWVSLMIGFQIGLELERDRQRWPET